MPEPTHQEIQRVYHQLAKDYHPSELDTPEARNTLYKRAKATAKRIQQEKQLNTNRNRTAHRTGFMDAVDDTENQDS